MPDERSAERPAVAQPQTKSSKTNPYCYDQCPSCGGIKAKQCKTCRECRYKRPEITQPNDPAIRHIPLTKGQFAVVDIIDYERLMQWKWYASWSKDNNTFYAMRTTVDRGTITMAREIMQPPSEMIVDHIDHNTLDNRRSNLRLATHANNQQNRDKWRRNTSGFKGIVLDKRDGAWAAKINHNNKSIYLGRFTSREDAARAYNEAALRLHGEFAVLNKID